LARPAGLEPATHIALDDQILSVDTQHGALKLPSVATGRPRSITVITAPEARRVFPSSVVLSSMRS